MNTQKKCDLLMIAYYFPPIGGSGALRPFKLAKYLPSFGWNPHILTVKNPDWYYANDPELLEELPPDIIIKRSFMLRSAWLYHVLNPLRIRKFDQALRRFLVLPDDQIGWIPFAYFSAANIIRKYKVKAIYSTSAPLSCHLIAYFIKRKKNIPWIADFRDEWFENPNLNHPTSVHRMLHYKLEGLVVNNCDKVIAPAARFCRLLAKHCPDSNKFSTIPMGFDPKDFTQQITLGDHSGEGRKFVLAFSGLFYGSFRPNIFLNAISELIEEGKVSPKKIKVQFVGANTPNDIDFKDVHGLCEFTGFISHKEALEYLRKANALLLLLSKERGKDVIPSKTFEYMASGKPILALVPSSGEVAKIIQKTNTGLVVNFEDVDSIKKAYLQLYKQWETRQNNFHPDKEVISKFNQKHLTKELALLLNEIV